MKKRLRLTPFIIIYISVIVTLSYCSNAKAGEGTIEAKTEEVTKYKYEMKITDDLLANTLKAEYPSDKWKVVPREEVCIPPSPCAKKQPETVETLHKKLSYDCPPCRKCVAEINQITTLRRDITEYRAEIQRLKNKLEEAEDRLELEQEKPAKIETVETVIKDDKRNYLYSALMYSQDGIIATEMDQEALYEATPVESYLVGGGYTHFFEAYDSFDFGMGLGAYIGQTGYAITGQIGVKF